MIDDKPFRDALPSARAWFDAFAESDASSGGQAIVCAGRRLDTVTVRDNLIRAFQVGIRVATSHGTDDPTSAGSVTIANNRMALTVPSEGLYAPYGLFVGNVRSLRLRDNELDLAAMPFKATPYAQGIRVWGFLGHLIHITGNRVAIATMGIRVNQVAAIPEAEIRSFSWIIADNLVGGAGPLILAKVSPNGIARLRDNVVQ